MSSQPKGLYTKFTVYRNDGRDLPGNDRQGAEYFVLDLTYDPFARLAIQTYANACEARYPELAQQLREKIVLG